MSEVTGIIFHHGKNLSSLITEIGSDWL